MCSSFCVSENGALIATTSAQGVKIGTNFGSATFNVRGTGASSLSLAVAHYGTADVEIFAQKNNGVLTVGQYDTTNTHIFRTRSGGDGVQFNISDTDKYAAIGNDGNGDGYFKLFDASDNVDIQLATDSNTDSWINSRALGVGTDTPDTSAKLQVSSVTKGFLPPVMTGAQVEAIASPTAGLLAYASNAGAGDVTTKGWWGWDGANFIQLG